MELEDKFRPHSKQYGGFDENGKCVTLDTAKQCVEIAEKFAVEFGEWMKQLDSWETYSNEHGRYYEINELLELYKQNLKTKDK